MAGLLLGIGFSVLLIVSVIPSLTFTDLNVNLDSPQFFTLQSELPARIVVPPSLPLVLLIYAGIVVTAVATMVRVVTRPSLERALRLDES